MNIKFTNNLNLKKRVQNSIYDKDTFKVLIDRERSRSDRYEGHFFSLVVLIFGKNSDQEKMLLFISALKNRVRSIDELGWVGEDIVGIMLTDTPHEGALGLARDIRDNIAPKELSFKIHIYSYPKDNIGNKIKKHEEEQENVFEQEDDLLELISKPIPVWKRAIDVIGASVALVILFPLFVLMGIYIKMVSPGPVFFKQERIGHAGRPFVCYKFRTMKVNADPEKHKKHVHDLIHSDKTLTKIDLDPDSGIILFGNLIRSLGIDELPQLINVLKGDMSLIGPRPCMEYEAVEFLNWQQRRFDTYPGLTGLWQVSGKNRTTFDEMMRLDVRYGKKLSLTSDVGIIFKTLPAVLRQAVDIISLKRKNRQ